MEEQGILALTPLGKLRERHQPLARKTEQQPERRPAPNEPPLWLLLHLPCQRQLLARAQANVSPNIRLLERDFHEERTALDACTALDFSHSLSIQFLGNAVT